MISIILTGKKKLHLIGNSISFVVVYACIKIENNPLISIFLQVLKLNCSLL